jgi:hypothetical protein
MGVAVLYMWPPETIVGAIEKVVALVALYFMKLRRICGCIWFPPFFIQRFLLNFISCTTY